MTAEQLLEIARREKPHIPYTRNRQGTAIAAWHEGRWQTVAMKLLGNMGWGSVGDLLVNGEPVNKPEDWLPAETAASA